MWAMIHVMFGVLSMNAEAVMNVIGWGVISMSIVTTLWALHLTVSGYHDWLHKRNGEHK